MSEITIEAKALITVITTTASVVSAYWLARRAASKDNLDLERQLHTLSLQVSAMSAKVQDRGDVKELVSESLASLSTILTALGNDTDANSDELKEVLIQQGILKEKVRTLEERLNVQYRT